MTIRGYEVSAKLILTVVAALALVIGTALFIRSCDRRHSEGAQSRVNEAQTGAMTNSAADAVNTQANVSANESASDDLTRSNEKDIRAADGANDAVKAPARDAGIAALCRRQAYRDNPRCKGAR